jgi:hypothetical protein
MSLLFTVIIVVIQRHGESGSGGYYKLSFII